MTPDYTPQNPPRNLRRYACPRCKCDLARIQHQGCMSLHAKTPRFARARAFEPMCTLCGGRHKLSECPWKSEGE